MAKKLTKKQYWNLFQKVSDELKSQILSEETANNIISICDRYEIEQVSQLASITGDVLLGILKPDEFEKTIEQELGLEKEVAKKVVQEINRFIFYPVKSSLEELHSMEITPPAQMKVPGPAIDKKPTTPKRKDTYREVIE